MSLCYGVCSLCTAPAVGFVAAIYLLVYILARTSCLNWRELGNLCAGLILLAAFVYFTLPLVGALITPVDSTEHPVGQDCELVRRNVLEHANEHPSRYKETISRQVDVDGDLTFERWEQIHARTGGLDFGSAVFVYEPKESRPRWCGSVTADQSILEAWIRPINLDLDLGREVWMRDAYFPFLPVTRGFVDFSANGARGFDPRLQILFILLPMRALPLLIWFRFRRRPILSITIAVVATLAYVLAS